MGVKTGLYFGDCLQGLRETEAGSVHLIVTDPPYGIGFQSNHRTSINLDVARPVEGDASFNKDWYEEIIKECHRVLADNTHFYVFTQDSVLVETWLVVQRFFTIKNLLVWDKGNTGMGDLEGQYGKSSEFVLFAHKGRRKLIGGRPPSVIPCQRVPPERLVHSCEKPVPLLSLFIEHSTYPGEIVCDPFAGSGSTAVASLRAGRQFLGWEVDPKTYEIAKGRLEDVKVQPTLF